MIGLRAFSNSYLLLFFLQHYHFLNLEYKDK